MNTKPTPIAVCTKCRQFTFKQEINSRCSEIYKGKRCTGTYRSSLSSEDWSLCEKCKGTGCEKCLNNGHFFIRT